MSTTIKLYVGLGAVLALFAGCTGDIGQSGLGIDDTNQDQPDEECVLLDFDTDGDGNAIAAGAIVEQAYATLGVHIDVFTDAAATRDGLGVAFDSDNPTGGDDDLAFSGLGNLLINQERFDAADIAAGFIAVPDDQARGALFELRFDDGACIKSLVLLDIDFGEDPAVVELFDAADNLIVSHSVAPMGSNVRLDVSLPDTTDCNVARMTVLISSSGAMDNVELCRTRMQPEIWTRVFDGGGDDVGNDVATDSARNAIVVGTAHNGANLDGLVRKYDSAGNLQWSQAIDGGDDDMGEGVAVDGSDNIIVAGSASNGTDRDVLVRKMDTDGNEIWTRPFDNGGEDGALAVAVDANDNIVVAGFITIGAGTDIFVRKYDSDGNTLWTQTADIGAQDVGYGVATDASGAVYVSGQSDNGSDVDFWVRKYDAAGTEEWTRIFDGGGDDGALGVAVDSSGNALVAGMVFNGANSDVFLRKFDSDGNTVWTRTYNGGGADTAQGVAVDAGDNVVITGYVAAAASDGWTRKYDADGNELWTKLFNRSDVEQGSGVAVDIAGSVIVTGHLHNGTDLDLWVQKYRP